MKERGDPHVGKAPSQLGIAARDGHRLGRTVDDGLHLRVEALGVGEAHQADAEGVFVELEKGIERG